MTAMDVHKIFPIRLRIFGGAYVKVYGGFERKTVFVTQKPGILGLLWMWVILTKPPKGTYLHH